MRSTLDNRKDLAAHYVRKWRVPQDIHVRKDITSGKPLAIFEFRLPSPSSGCRYATNGISGGQRPLDVEVFSATRKPCPWVIQTMDALARYPFQNGIVFSAYDTIESGPIDGGKGQSPFTAILLAPSLSNLDDSPGDLDYQDRSIKILQLVGLFKDELPLVHEIGAEKFLEKMRNGNSLFIDESRAIIS